MAVPLLKGADWSLHQASLGLDLCLLFHDLPEAVTLGQNYLPYDSLLFVVHHKTVHGVTGDADLD